MNDFRILCVVALLAGFASPARADVIVIDPSDYPLGTDLSALMLPGLSLAKLSQSEGTTYSPTVSPVVTAPAWPSPYEPSMGATFGFYDYARCVTGTGFGNPCVGYNVLELRFDAPTNWVQINGRFNSDAPLWTAYDVLDNPIAGYGGGSQLGITETFIDVAGTGQLNLVLASGERNIARIVYGGDNTVSPTQISYHVSEPTTMALMGLGLLGAGLLRVRGRRAQPGSR